VGDNSQIWDMQSERRDANYLQDMMEAMKRNERWVKISIEA